MSYYETAVISGTTGNYTAAVQTGAHGNTWTTHYTSGDGSPDGFTGTTSVTTPNGTVTTTYGGSNSVSTATEENVSGVTKLGTSVTASTDPAISVGDAGKSKDFSGALGLKYTTFGTWTLAACPSSGNCGPTYFGTYGGAQPGQSLTPTTAVPTTGYASYWGGATGAVFQPSTVNGNNVGLFYGTFGLTANFANGSIVGAITNTQVYSTSNGTGSQTNLGSLNDIAISATISGNTYSGTVTASTTDSSGNTPTGFDIGGSAGHLIGGFYGSAAQETAGTFYLTGGTNSTQLVGSFGAAAGSDFGNATQTVSHFVYEDTISGMPGSTLAASPDGLSTSLIQFTADTSPAGFTKLVTYTTPGGTIVVEEGGAQQFSSSGGRDGVTGVQGGNLIILSSTDPAVTTAGGGSWETFGKVVGLQYADFGLWNISPTGNNASSQTPLYAGAGAGGKAGVAETASMPTTGTASFSGGAVGYVVKGGTGGEFYGTSTLTANFATGGGTVTGTISNINVYSFNNNTLSGTMNDISINATIAGAGNTKAEYSGTATAQGAAGTAVDITGATGPLKGAFYGPTAQETAGTFQMSGGGAQVLGSFGAKPATPSDRRLKVEIAPAGRLANGLALYSWRYLGGRRRFTGVMAQDLLNDARFADAVKLDHDGLMRVDYARIGFIPLDSAAMAAEGELAVGIYRATLH
jgi:hypothetical protein